ncbi:hypothetical protein MTR67_023059 [Solanum verrucosum]|uniref:Uncharacterized protein n=1 Tax=Solanum verrucosum TaxID=315347 RepID=A0AAF0R158_SOLVR|nr:hypothetical protein MTR67_023059 [Solanum verrucosum]
MTILRHNRREFTWTNGHTYSRIYWALVNVKWMFDMQSLEVKVLSRGCSEHSPFCIALMKEEDIRHKPFKFLNHLAKHENFQKIVQRAWQQRPSNGTIIRMYRQDLYDIQYTMRNPGQAHDIIEFEMEVKLNLEKWLNIEKSIIKKKSRVQWLQLGDGNTTYFHTSLKNIIAQKKITSLITNTGRYVTSRTEIEEEITAFYKQLLRSYATQLPAVNQKVMKDGSVLNRSQQAQLITLVSKNEVVMALKGINDNKAPGCDGFNAYFLLKKGLVADRRGHY